ncbi:MAG TPA: GntR family transcriptional regulator [Thermodesulfobacteriota bacterium]
MSASSRSARVAGPRAQSDAFSQAIYQSLRGQIIDGHMQPGSRLPTERALAARFRAARNTVRKTMTRLVQEGLVVRHVGRGTFVAEAAGASAGRPHDGAAYSLTEILEARLLFEPGLAELVVERASDEDLLALTSHLEALKAARTWYEFKEAKYALHLAIARASRNRFVEDMFRRIVASRRRSGWDRPGGHPLPVSAVREAALRDNVAIVEALARRDAQAARELIRTSLLRTLLSISGS